MTDESRFAPVFLAILQALGYETGTPGGRALANLLARDDVVTSQISALAFEVQSLVEAGDGFAPRSRNGAAIRRMLHDSNFQVLESDNDFSK